MRVTLSASIPNRLLQQLYKPQFGECSTTWQKSHLPEEMALLLLFELVDNLVQEGALPFILGTVFPHFIGIVEKSILLVLIEPFRNGHIDFHIEIAFPAGLEVGHAFSGNAEPGTILGACRDLQFHFLVQSLHLDGGAQGCHGIGNIDGPIEVVPFPFEVRIFLYVNVYVQVSFRTSPASRFPFTGYPHADAIICTGGDIDFDGLGSPHRTDAMAFAALVFNDFSGAATLLAGHDIHHLAKGAIPYDSLLAGPMAGGAGIYGRARFCAIAMAVIADFILCDGELLFHPCKGFPKGNGHVVAKVCTLFRTIIPAAAATGEHVENVAHVESAEVESLAIEAALPESAEPAGAGSTTGCLLEGIMAELVVLGSLVSIGKYMVRFIHFLELFFRFLGMVLVQVRMVFTGKSPICFFDFIVRGVFAYAKDVIVILAVCHKELTLFLISCHRHERLCNQRLLRCLYLSWLLPAGMRPVPAAVPGPAVPAGTVFLSVHGAAWSVHRHRL